ncbi:MAG: HAD hydrolase-like protein [Chloroflexi bacterium]|nr:HAD hydrolase-like protein [Chloroflexota bacterium]MDA1145588.1 HAD hydrolase-like protein [Chloroflexota bacterium]
MRYDHVIWDWNGTLFDDVDLVVEVANLMLGRRALPGIDRVRYQEVFGFPVRGYYERVGFDLDREPFEALSVEFIAEYDARWREHRLREDAHASTEALHRRGVTQSMLSASEQGMLNTVTAHFEIGRRMSALVGIDDHHAASKLDHGLAHLGKIETPRERVLLVGDTEHDFEVATAMGIDCVLVEDGHAPRERLVATGAPTHRTLTELLREVL